MIVPKQGRQFFSIHVLHFHTHVHWGGRVEIPRRDLRAAIEMDDRVAVPQNCVLERQIS